MSGNDVGIQDNSVRRVRPSKNTQESGVAELFGELHKVGHAVAVARELQLRSEVGVGYSAPANDQCTVVGISGLV